MKPTCSRPKPTYACLEKQLQITRKADQADLSRPFSNRGVRKLPFVTLAMSRNTFFRGFANPAAWVGLVGLLAVKSGTSLNPQADLLARFSPPRSCHRGLATEVDSVATRDRQGPPQSKTIPVRVLPNNICRAGVARPHYAEIFQRKQNLVWYMSFFLFQQVN
jgi:hypothetical protein